MDSRLLGNIEFIFDCSKRGRMPELYLYYKLRLYGTGRGGYLDGYGFTNNERYRVLPKLVKYGWVEGFSGGKAGYKLKSHRKVACSRQNTQINVRYGIEETKDIETFRSWVVSLAEEYSATNNWKKQKGKSKRYSHRDKAWMPEQVNGNVQNKHKIEKFKRDNQEYLKARVSNGFIGGLLGVSERTVSSWRSTPFSWRSRKDNQQWYRVLNGFNTYFLRDAVGCVYDKDCIVKKNGTPVRKDLKIHIPRRIFTHRYHKGYYAVSS